MPKTAEAKQGGLRIVIDHVFDKDGALIGIVQLWDGEDLVDGRRMALDDAEMRQEMAKRFTEAGVDKADAELAAAINDARRAFKDSRGPGYGPIPEDKFFKPAQWYLDQLRKPQDNKPARFLITDFGRFYMNGTTNVPVDIRSDDMLAILRSKLRLNKTQKMTGFLLAEIETETLLHGERVKIHRASYFNPDRGRHGTLYFDTYSGKVLRIDDAGKTLIDNGEDEVLFQPPPFAEPWTYNPEPKNRLWPEFIEKLNFATGEYVPFSVAQQRLLFFAWIMSILFRDCIAEGRPIALAMGERGSGKSTGFRIVGEIYFGSKFRGNKLDGEKEDQYWTNVSNRPLVVYDGVDTMVKWFADAITTTSDGIDIAKRILHKTNELGLFTVDAFLALTSRTPLAMRRDDVADRLWLYLFKRLEKQERVGAQKFQLWLHAHRNDLLSELVNFAQLVVRVPEPDVSNAPLRMVDATALLYRIGDALDLGVKEMVIPEFEAGGTYRQAVEQIARLQSQAQAQFASEEDGFVLALTEWLGKTSPEGQFNAGRKLAAKTLLAELQKIAAEEGIDLAVKSPRGLGKHMASQRSLLQTFFRWETDRKGGLGTVYQVWPAGEENGGKLL